MTTEFKDDLIRLSQTRLLEKINQEIRLTEMVTVYLNDTTNDHDFCFFSALIPSIKAEDSLSNLYLNLDEEFGLPSCVGDQDNDERRIKYLRYNNTEGVEPLVIEREFYGIRPNYLEVSEEFRLFHRLYHDRKQDHYFKINDAGNEDLVGIVEPHRIQIRLKEIRQFLAIKEMHLVIFFEFREYSSLSLTELRLKEGSENFRQDLLRWRLHYGNLFFPKTYQSFSQLLGKRLIVPLPKDKSGFSGFGVETPKKYVDFIISTDNDGNETTHTSNPSRLVNNCGANSDVPQYLTPVHFRKTVLDKYYQESSKYSVTDGVLRCGGLWGMRMDNHHDDKVVACLGDLGSKLSYEEQLHWRSHNISPVGYLSKTFFKRQILAMAAHSNRPEHLFRKRYEQLDKLSMSRLNWALLLPLTKEDDHYPNSIRVPSTNEQKDFDDLVLGLVKVLIDSLNQDQLFTFIPSDEKDKLKDKSISLLERVFNLQGVQDFKEHIKFLRTIQSLRSEGVAHRKGKNYIKIATQLGIEEGSLMMVFDEILKKALAFLEFLVLVVQTGFLDRPRELGNAPT